MELTEKHIEYLIAEYDAKLWAIQSDTLSNKLSEYRTERCKARDSEIDAKVPEPLRSILVKELVDKEKSQTESDLCEQIELAENIKVKKQQEVIEILKSHLE